MRADSVAPVIEKRMPIDLRRNADARVQVSRIAADLFWRDGVAATRGEDIAAEAGIATRTLWRYFRSKESCVEPILAQLGRRFSVLLQAWPLELSLDDYVRPGMVDGPVTYSDDDVAAMRIVVLGFDDPALRSAWLMVCDAAERESTVVFAPRLGLPAESDEVRQVAASVSGAIRAQSDALSRDFVSSGVAPRSEDVLRSLLTAIRDASNGRIGPAV